jgi:methylenetetrahydrofolate dehydrogenase (NADP+)/methenyltetrahydrofolate cyclohydrolase
VRNKVKACEDSGLHSVLEKYDATLTEADLLARIAALNADPAIHGILVQMPLPKHIDRTRSSRPSRPPRTWTAFTSPAPAR